MVKLINPSVHKGDKVINFTCQRGHLVNIDFFYGGLKVDLDGTEKGIEIPKEGDTYKMISVEDKFSQGLPLGKIEIICETCKGEGKFESEYKISVNVEDANPNLDELFKRLLEQLKKEMDLQYKEFYKKIFEDLKKYLESFNTELLKKVKKIIEDIFSMSILDFLANKGKKWLKKRNDE